MPDNVGYTPGSGAAVACDEVPYSGDTTKVQLVRLVHVSGAEGSKTLSELSTNPLPTYHADPSVGTAFGPITAPSTVLFTAIDTANEETIQLQLTGLWSGGIGLEASMDGTTWFACAAQSTNADNTLVDTIFSPDRFVVQVVARYFRAVTAPTFKGTVSGTYALRSSKSPINRTDSYLIDADPGLKMPIAGTSPAGYITPIAVSPGGGVVPADGTVFQGTRNPATVGPILIVDTIGYGAVTLQLQGTFTGTITFQVSNDLTSWASVIAWPSGGGAAAVTSATAVGQWVIPASGRYFRAQITTAGTGIPIAIVVLKNFSAFYPSSIPQIAANSSVNVGQIGGQAVVNGGVNGVQSVGGNIAVGAAPTANPVPVGGWDGTNTRRILTDASSGGVVLGSSAATNGQTVARITQTATTPAVTQVKGTSGRLTMLNVSNAGTVAGFLHVFASGTASLGVTADVHCYAIPGAVSNYPITLPDGGLFLTGGIALAFTNGSTSTDNTNFGSAPTLIANYAFI
jgi:hypothetical protein